MFTRKKDTAAPVPAGPGSPGKEKPKPKPKRMFCETCLNTGLIKCATCNGARTVHRKKCASAKRQLKYKGVVRDRNVPVCRKCVRTCEDEGCEFGHSLVICMPCRKGRKLIHMWTRRSQYYFDSFLRRKIGAPARNEDLRDIKYMLSKDRETVYKEDKYRPMEFESESDNEPGGAPLSSFDSDDSDSDPSDGGSPAEDQEILRDWDPINTLGTPGPEALPESSSRASGSAAILNKLQTYTGWRKR